MTWVFDEFEVQPQRRRVLRGGQPLALGARAFDLLQVLIEHRDRVVSKDELLSRAWPGLVVEENNLTVQVSALRKALGAAAITTVPGRGYRFAATVGASAVPPGEAAAAPAATHRPGLPAQRSSFVGRVAETAALRELLRTHRLVTLTGLGGAGKTRLAIQVARSCAPRAPDGAWFADLSPVRHADDLPRVVADAVGVDLGDAPRVGPAGSAAERLTGALAARAGLLVLDNCEHLLDAAARLVDALLAQAPQMAVLATSREPLGVEGEQVFPLQPLPVPGDDADGDADTDATRLFAERAAQARPGFALQGTTRAAVAAICRGLDGLPLAIEFAAARVAHLSPQQIAERLSERLRLLGGGRARGAHQQTLAAALDWSHELLSPQEQAVLRRLTTFSGGFDLGLAEAVCAGDGVAPDEVLDRLASLVAKSLVVAEPAGDASTRYRMLETVRLYAEGKLAAAGEADVARARHRDAMLAWLESLPEQDRWFDVRTFDRIGRETGNLERAAAWSEHEDRPDLLARQIMCVWNFCFWSNYYAQALRQVGVALRDEARLSAPQRIGCRVARALFEKMALELPTFVAHADQAVALSRGQPGIWLGAALLMRGHGRAAMSGFPGADPELLVQARQDLQHARAVVAQSAPRAWTALVEVFIGWLEVNAGDLPAAAQAFQRCIEAGEPHGRPGWPLLAAWSGLACALHLQGQVDAAGRAALSFLAAQDALADASAWMASNAVELIPALCAAGHQAEADAQLRLGAARMRRSGVPLAPNSFLIAAAGAAFERGDPERGARLLGAARFLGGADREAMPFRTALGLSLFQHYGGRARDGLDREAAQAARAWGRSATIDQAFALALHGVGAAAS